MRFPRVFSSAPSGSDHSLTVPSKLPEISRLPSGLMATRATEPGCASAPETQVAAWPRLGSTSAAAAAAAALNRLRRLSAQPDRSEEHTSELQSLRHLVCRLLLE